MDDVRWNGGTEEFRALQALARQGRHQEALERAGEALMAGNLGRRYAARIHSLICWLYTDGIHRSCPTAVLHGEEAVRLSDQIDESWVKCEALSRLVHAYCHLGDLVRARAACEAVAVEVERNAGAIDGGMATVWTLRAAVAAAAGDAEAALAALEQAELQAIGGNADIMTRIRSCKVPALLSCGRRAEAVRVVAQVPAQGQESLDWAVTTAWVTLEASGPAEARPLIQDVMERAQTSGNLSAAAHGLALQALMVAPHSPAEAHTLALLAISRARTAGRVDLVRQFRRRFHTLLTT